MAVTEYGVNHPLAVKAWERKLAREALKRCYVGKFMGKGTGNVIQVKNDLSKGPGDRVTVGLRMQLSGAGIQGDSTLEGNEEALTTYSDNLFIDQLRHAVRRAGKMSEQRVPFDVRDEAMSGLADWWADRIDTWFFNQVCGNTGVSDQRYTGLQATVAPSTTTAGGSGNTRFLLGDGVGTSAESSISASQFFQLSYIDRAVVQAQTATPLIRPITGAGDVEYVMFLHPWQVYNLRTDVSSSRITWFQTQLGRVQGGERDSNPIFSGALGIYNNVLLHQSVRIPAVVSNTRRAVLCGAQAAIMAFGQGSSDKPNWFEELFDYGNQLGVAGGMIAGLKKSVFNSIDFGTIVVSTYATAPA